MSEISPPWRSTTREHRAVIVVHQDAELLGAQRLGHRGVVLRVGVQARAVQELPLDARRQRLLGEPPRQRARHVVAERRVHALALQRELAVVLPDGGGKPGRQQHQQGHDERQPQRVAREQPVGDGEVGSAGAERRERRSPCRQPRQSGPSQRSERQHEQRVQRHRQRTQQPALEQVSECRGADLDAAQIVAALLRKDRIEVVELLRLARLGEPDEHGLAGDVGKLFPEQGPVVRQRRESTRRPIEVQVMARVSRIQLDERAERRTRIRRQRRLRQLAADGSREHGVALERSADRPHRGFQRMPGLELGLGARKRLRAPRRRSLEQAKQRLVVRQPVAPGARRRATTACRRPRGRTPRTAGRARAPWAARRARTPTLATSAPPTEARAPRARLPCHRRAVSSAPSCAPPARRCRRAPVTRRTRDRPRHRAARRRSGRIRLLRRRRPPSGRRAAHASRATTCRARSIARRRRPNRARCRR